MKAKAVVMNENQSGQFWVLTVDHGHGEWVVSVSAPNNWKTKKGAECWARKHGFELV